MSRHQTFVVLGYKLEPKTFAVDLCEKIYVLKVQSRQSKKLRDPYLSPLDEVLCDFFFSPSSSTERHMAACFSCLSPADMMLKVRQRIQMSSAFKTEVCWLKSVLATGQWSELDSQLHTEKEEDGDRKCGK